MNGPVTVLALWALGFAALLAIFRVARNWDIDPRRTLVRGEVIVSALWFLSVPLVLTMGLWVWLIVISRRGLP